MLTNRDDDVPGAKLRHELRNNPMLTMIIEVFQSATEGFEIVGESEGLELAPLDPVGGTIGRCRMKIFRPREGKDRFCAFFFKKSNLAWSTDRFSYGGVEFQPSQLTESDARAWLAWLVSGFDPGQRPEHLRRAFLYDIPE